MRGQRKPKIIRKARNIQRSIADEGCVIVPHADKVIAAIFMATKRTKEFAIARDFDCCVKNALEREKNL